MITDSQYTYHFLGNKLLVTIDLHKEGKMRFNQIIAVVGLNAIGHPELT